MSRHLEAVPDGEPAPRVSTERFELPTGGRKDVDRLLRELCQFAFPEGLASFELMGDGPRVRCFVSVRGTADQIDGGRNAVLGALLALGIVQLKKEPPPSPPLPEQSAP